MNALLHVEKEKGVEVLFRPALDEYFGSTELSGQSPSILTSVTIESYSKDSHILSGSGSSAKMEIENVPKGFRQYLYDRKKAGVISYKGSTLYVLPPRNRDDTVLAWSTPVKSNRIDHSSDQASNPSVQSRSSNDAKSSSSSSTKASSVMMAPSQIAPPPPNSKNDGDFLSSLLNKVCVMGRTWHSGKAIDATLHHYCILELLQLNASVMITCGCYAPLPFPVMMCYTKSYFYNTC